MVSWLSSILGILLVDLTLSGDNAVVIGAAAAGLPHSQRMIAIIVGGIAAIAARIVLALAATNLLQLPFIGAIGSIILLFIAIRLLIERSTEWKSARNKLSQTVKPHSQQKKPHLEPSQTPMDRPVQKKSTRNDLFIAITTILLADVTMSLDNILAIGGLAEGKAQPLIIGLLFSVIFLLVGSAMVAKLISYLPWLLDLACLLVAWTAAQIFLGDDSLNSFFTILPWLSYVMPIIALTLVMFTDILLCVKNRRHPLHL